MKNTIILLLGILVFASCSSDSEDFLYEGVDKIYFSDGETATYEKFYSLGELPMEENIFTVEVPVALLGKTSKEDRYFHLEVDEKQTTSLATFEKLESKYLFPKDTIAAVVKINLNRNKMLGTQNDTLTLVLKPSKDFALGIEEALHYTLIYNNILSKPFWWNRNDIKKYLGGFRPEKYQKYLELYNKPITYSDISSHRLEVLKRFKKVKEFFDKNPQYNVHFPKIDWPI